MCLYLVLWYNYDVAKIKLWKSISLFDIKPKKHFGL